MTDRRKLLGVTLAAALAALPAIAQQPASAAPPGIDTAQLKDALTQGRRQLFSAGMGQLPPKELETFWAIYGDFEKERGGIMDQRMTLLKDYATKYKTMAPSDATGWINTIAKLQIDEVNLRKKYTDVVSQKISPAAGARFWQIDDYISTAAKLDILDNVPLVKAGAK
jgi:hypothetical protein